MQRALEYLWDLHPLVDWLTDRGQIAFPRHCAPVLQLSDGLEPGEVVMVFQSTIPNQKGVPVVLHRDAQPAATASVDSIDGIASRTAPMATLTIRNLEESTKAQLRLQAARHGRSMEEEARVILRQGVIGSQAAKSREGIGNRIHSHFARLGGVELELPARADHPQAPDLGGATG